MKNKTHTILGAIIGDVIGSVYEFAHNKRIDFELFNEQSQFTDDTVLTLAIADAIMHRKDFAKTVWDYGNKYSCGMFHHWLSSDILEPYSNYSNGSAMRVSAVGFAYDTMEEVLKVAEQTASITHNHKEGIKGAQAIASAIFLARQGKSKKEIKDFIEQTFHYDLSFTLDEIRADYEFDATCQGSVPQAIVAFLESTDYENAIRLAISIGGDSDTIACMTGGIAMAYYNNIPNYIVDFVMKRLPQEFIDTINEFEEYLNKHKAMSLEKQRKFWEELKTRGIKKYQKYAPIFENLYQNKIIYHEGITRIVRLENLEITDEYFQAKAIKEKVILTKSQKDRFRKYNTLEKVLNKSDKWTFRGTWGNAIISENPLRIGSPYANFVIWIEPNFVKNIERLAEYGDDEDALKLLWNR
ncbi:MAG: ADP-ribosylglycohydrolase family protein [Tenacibaculum sp.]|nr:ADP-ribosylglycohydrolase family protein [Tenacibaculum sp.]